MIKTETRLIVTFHTTADAMKTEKLCRAAALPGKLVPVPRALTSDCGIAWATKPELRAQLEAVLRDVPYAAIQEAEF